MKRIVFWLVFVLGLLLSALFILTAERIRELPRQSSPDGAPTYQTIPFDYLEVQQWPHLEC